MSLRCEVCDLNLNSSWQYKQHLQGKSHAKKLKKLSSGDQSGPPTLPGNKRTINFVKSGEGQPDQVSSDADEQGSWSAAPSKTPTTAVGSSDDVPLYCSLCLIELNSKEQAQIHYSGTKHLRKVRTSRLQTAGSAGSAPSTEGSAQHGLFYCGFCHITVNSAQQMTVHREGSKHKRMVEGMKRHAGESDTNSPAAKKPTTDLTNNTPQVDQSEIVPFEQMYPVSSTTTTTTTKTGL